MNSRLDELQAAVREQSFLTWTRTTNGAAPSAARYDAGLGGRGPHTCRCRCWPSHVFHQVRHQGPDGVMSLMACLWSGHRYGHPLPGCPFHAQPAYVGRLPRPVELPATEAAGW